MIDLRECGIADLDVTDAALILTDPPYVPEADGAVETLFLRAHSMLADGGSILAMVGQRQLATVFSAAARSDLVYRWAISYQTPGPQPRHFPLRLWIDWKPIVWFSRGSPQRRKWTSDTFRSAKLDKAHHEWGQPIDVFKHLILTFSRRGDLVVDPFLGAGTTAVAAALTGREFVGCDIDAAAVRRSQARIDAAVEYRRAERAKVPAE